MMKNLKQRKADVLLLAILLAAGCVLALLLIFTKRSGDEVQVRVDGEVVASYLLSVNNTYEIEGAGGGSNLLVICDGQAWISDASCPDGLCMGMGKISQSGQSVICLPNKVVVEIISNTEDSPAEIDMIAG